MLLIFFKEISLLIKITYSVSWKSCLAQEFSQTKWDRVTCVAAHYRFGKKTSKMFLLFAIFIQTVKFTYGCKFTYENCLQIAVFHASLVY